MQSSSSAPQRRRQVAARARIEPAPRRSSGRSVGHAVSAFESETAALIARTAPSREHIVMYALCAMVVISLLLISMTHIDRVVDARGHVVTTGGLLYVQPLEKAIVRDIRVTVGQIVSKGQPLATLDPTFSNADVADLKQKVLSAEAHVARLNAEYEDRPYTPPGDNAFQALQSTIWSTRQAEKRSAVADFHSRIKSLEATIAKYRQDMDTLEKRQKIAAELEQIYLTIEAKGYGAKEKVLSTTDSRMEVERLLADAKNGIGESEHARDALEAQLDVYLQQRQSSLSTELVAARTEFEEAQTNLTKAKKINELISLDSPEDAVVLKIGKVSQGSVANPGGEMGEPLFTLVPLASPLEAEVRVRASDIGFIQVGDPVQIKLDAYQFYLHGIAKGTIKTISEGTFAGEDDATIQPAIERESQQTYFKVRIAFTEVNLRNVPASFRLIPGLSLDADIMVGRRTILSYLLGGVLLTGSEAMREP